MQSIEAEREIENEIQIEIENEIEKEELSSTIAGKDNTGKKTLLIIILIKVVPIKLGLKGNYK